MVVDGDALGRDAAEAQVRRERGRGAAEPPAQSRTVRTQRTGRAGAHSAGTAAETNTRGFRSGRRRRESRARASSCSRASCGRGELQQPRLQQARALVVARHVGLGARAQPLDEGEHARPLARVDGGHRGREQHVELALLVGRQRAQAGGLMAEGTGRAAPPGSAGGSRCARPPGAPRRARGGARRGPRPPPPARSAAARAASSARPLRERVELGRRARAVPSSTTQATSVTYVQPLRYACDQAAPRLAVLGPGAVERAALDAAHGRQRALGRAQARRLLARAGAREVIREGDGRRPARPRRRRRRSRPGASRARSARASGGAAPTVCSLGSGRQDGGGDRRDPGRRVAHRRRRQHGRGDLPLQRARVDQPEVADARAGRERRQRRQPPASTRAAAVPSAARTAPRRSRDAQAMAASGRPRTPSTTRMPARGEQRAGREQRHQLSEAARPPPRGQRAAAPSPGSRARCRARASCRARG